MKFRLYCGLVKSGKWFNHTEIEKLHGGVLSLLEGADNSGGAKLINLMKGSFKSLFTEDGDEYKMDDKDYGLMFSEDVWKVGYEQIKLSTNNDHPVIPESFFCGRCSYPGQSNYTDVEECWQDLIDDGLIDEIYAENPEFNFEVQLPDPIVIEGMRTIQGGTFDKVIMRKPNLNDVIMVQKDQKAMESRASMVYANWDETLIEVVGMPQRDLNILKRTPGASFAKKYLAVSQENIDAIAEAQDINTYGIIAKDRKVFCRNCGADIGGGLDFTNFFSALSQKKRDLNLSNQIQA